MNFQYDAQYALIHILEMMSTQQISLSELVDLLPNVNMLREYVPCPWDKKGKVMRRLMEDIRDNNVELVDGIKVFHPQGGWTLILPDVEATDLYRLFPRIGYGSSEGRLRRNLSIKSVSTSRSDPICQGSL